MDKTMDDTCHWGNETPLVSSPSKDTSFPIQNSMAPDRVLSYPLCHFNTYQGVDTRGPRIFISDATLPTSQGTNEGLIFMSILIIQHI